MKKYILIILLVVATILVFTINKNQDNDRQQIEGVVSEFGLKLKNASLLSSNTPLETKENYEGYISPGLMDQWVNDPMVVLGRLTSSPWSEGIIIDKINKSGPNTYNVSGRIINKTSDNLDESQSIEISLIKLEGRWLIDRIQLIPKNDPLEEFNFSFKYPEELTNYISSGEWNIEITESQNSSALRILDEGFGCENSSNAFDKIEERIIDGQLYCVEESIDEITSTDYKKYRYSTFKNGRVATIIFDARYPLCGNYPE
ncbi:MAG: hypothetical protein PHV25_02930, partial [Candidatus Pacebacteria bacterium]|nr:hypothetical protein [Candidatus Paceibacterota bacterium]